MARRPEETERTVARVGAGVILTLAAFVGAALVSNAHHPRADRGETAIAQALTAADPSPASPFVRVAPAPLGPVREASGDPLLRTGFGHLRVAPAVTYANLTLFPVYREGAASKTDGMQFATLETGLSNGDVTAREPGGDNSADGLTVPLPSATNAEEGAEHRGANLLYVTNTGPQPTYVPDGQVAPGGGQDRGAAADTVVPARSANVAVAAYCVEHGRGMGPTETFTKDVAIAIPSVRYAMQVVGEQQPVWDAVGVATGHFGARTETGTYHALVASPAAQAAVTPYADALTLPVQEAAHGRPVGVVVAVNGKIVCADLYRDTALFAQLWPSLLRSYALQAAMLSKGAGQDAVDAPAAARWLAALDSAPGAQTRHSDLTEVARVATDVGAGTRTVAIAGARGDRMALLHEAFWTPAAVLTE